MKRYAAIVLVTVMFGCDGSGPTLPTVVATPAPPSAPVVVAAPSPQPVDGQPVKFWEGSILPFAGWDVKNVGPQKETWTAYYTSLDNQSLPLGSTKTTINRGDSFRGTFNKPCVQVDITQGGPGDTPFLAGFIDHNGKVVRASQIDREKCNPKPPCRSEQCDPTPYPTPTPSPSPTPTPPVGLCYYRVSCGVSFSNSCTDHSQQLICENKQGIWINFDGNVLDNHCKFNVPGVSLSNFQLNPGQSAQGCLNKNS